MNGTKYLALIAALLLMMCVFTLGICEEEARDITADCTLSSGGRPMKNLFDRQYTSFWRSEEMRNPSIEITAPEGIAAEYLYICFGDMPESWAIEEEIDGSWQLLMEGSRDYHHAFLELGGKTRIRLIDTSDKTSQFKINELFVFSEGKVPDWVQRWEPACENADLLLLTAHPGDELLFLGGAIPTYVCERKINVVIACMTYSNTTRRSELLNGLWHMGVRNYPIIGEFRDSYCSKLDDAYKKWGKEETQAFVTELLRKYKPEVVVTHDVDGENGHGAHKLCADVMQFCVAKAGSKGFMPDSADKYGTWDVQKLYLHLYDQSPITLNWNVPLDSMNGKTSLDLVKEAYALHVTQESSKNKVTDQGSASSFGLAYSAVGPDLNGGDFMENIYVAPTPRPDGTTPEPTPTPSPTPAPSPTPYREKVTAEVDWPDESQVRDEYGYLVSGEYVYDNEEEGLWFYASPTLVVRIDRTFDPEDIVTLYEAHIFCDTYEEAFGAILHNPEKPQSKHVQPALIAREKQVVFACNTDYYTYRIGRKTITGMVIRDRNVFFKRVPEANRSQFPNLDTLAMYEDGSWEVYHSDELTAEEYLEKGAVDVFSFGPYLVRDGKINPFIAETKNGKTPQPRCAIGMVEPGHYVAILAEGRNKKESVGVSIEFLANQMLDAGCTESLNLDGGQTAVMLFMGNQISRIEKYSGHGTRARTTTEIVGIGRSDLIDPSQKPNYAEFK